MLAERTITAECLNCGSSGDVELPTSEPGLLECPECGRPMAHVGVAAWSDWIEAQVNRKSELLRTGKMGTRKQSSRQSDTDIDRDGMAAEMAACIILCPSSLPAWMTTVERGGNNRGRDFPASLTRFDKPVEVKQTTYHGETTGCLIVRPPRWTPGPMRTEYLDDSYYVLLCGRGYEYTAVGWIDRASLATRGMLNPVPVRPGQRECWGIHWKKLNPLADLVIAFERG